MESKTFETNYLTAVNWLNGNLILCNNIEDIDHTIYERLYEEQYDCEDEDEDQYIEVYQWFLTSYSNRDVEFLRKHFGLTFVYSEVLDLWVLCVTHYGTAWDYVYWVTDLEQAKCELSERK